MVKGMILLITPSIRRQECAQAMKLATDQVTEVAATFQEAGDRLRAQECDAVIVEQFLVDVEPDESDQMLQPVGTATAIHVNFAISGIDRVVRDLRLALTRRQREEQRARQSIKQAVWCEVRESLTAMLLSCDLALAIPGVPTVAIEKVQSVHDSACQLRARMQARD
jgi:hypothetical protein